MEISETIPWLNDWHSKIFSRIRTSWDWKTDDEEIVKLIEEYRALSEEVIVIKLEVSKLLTFYLKTTNGEFSKRDCSGGAIGNISGIFEYLEKLYLVLSEFVTYTCDNNLLKSEALLWNKEPCEVLLNLKRIGARQADHVRFNIKMFRTKLPFSPLMSKCILGQMTP